MKKIYFLSAIIITSWLSSYIYASELNVIFVTLYDGYYKTKQRDYISLLKFEDEFSIRIKSMDRNLVGIVSDTITDMFWNPARLPSKSFISYQIPNRLITSFPGPFGSRWGILLEGSYSKSESENRYTEPSDIYIYTDYLRSRSGSYFRNRYKGALLGAKQITPNTCVGLRLDYSLKPYKESEKRVFRYTRERDFDSRTLLSIREDVDEYTRADTVSSYSFSIGTLSSIWNSDLEIILGFVSKKVAIPLQDMETNSNYNEATEIYDSIIDVDIYNNEYQWMLDEYDFLNPKLWTLGFRFSKKITPTSTFRTVATVYRGSGDSQRRRDNQDYYYRYRYHSHTDPDTSYIRSDTSETYEEIESILEGDVSILGGFLVLGQEFNFSPKISLGVGIKVSYERSELRLEGTKYEIDDTLTSQSVIDEMDIEKRAYIYLPLGIEYKPIPEIVLRAGFSIHGSYQFSEDKINGESFKSKYVKGPFYDISIGAGLNWKQLDFNIYARDISAIRLWDIEVGYSF